MTRESETRFLVVTSAASQTRDLAWLKRNLGGGACGRGRRDLGLAVLGLMGPRSRDLLRKTDRRRSLQRGVPVRDVAGDRPRLRAGAGEPQSPMSASSAGSSTSRPNSRKASSTRSSRRRRVRPETRRLSRDELAAASKRPTATGATTYGRGHARRGRPRLRGEARQGTRLHRPRGAAERRRERGVAAPARAIRAARTKAPLIYHNEPVFREGRLVGRIASGMFGHTLGRAIGLGYVENGGEVVAPMGTAGDYEIEIAGRPLARPRASAAGLRSRGALRVSAM